MQPGQLEWNAAAARIQIKARNVHLTARGRWRKD